MNDIDKDAGKSALRAAPDAAELEIPVESARLPQFFQLLQQGITLRSQVGCSVRSFLLCRLQLSDEFIQDKIQTIFLDGKPVDDLDTAYVKDGCTLALSAAMPGLVGATMRRGGYYASLRAQISHCAEAENAPAASEGFITLKLFNFLTDLVGKKLLQDGVFAGRRNLEDVLNRLPLSELKGIRVSRGGKPLDWNTFRVSGSSGDMVLLRVKIS